MNKSLFANNKNPKRSLKGTGFANADIAKKSLLLIDYSNSVYKEQVLNTLYNRAKYHPHQKKEHRDAMKIFKKELEKNKKIKNKIMDKINNDKK